MPKRKSAEDIREQTNRICRLAVESLRGGKMSSEEFGRRIMRITDIENRYTENIQNNPLCVLEFKNHSLRANKIAVPRTEYMLPYDRVPCT